MPDEVDQIKPLKKENRTLKSALAPSQVKILALEALIADVEADLKINVNKPLVTGNHHQRYDNLIATLELTRPDQVYIVDITYLDRPD